MVRAVIPFRRSRPADHVAEADLIAAEHLVEALAAEERGQGRADANAADPSAEELREVWEALGALEPEDFDAPPAQSTPWRWPAVGMGAIAALAACLVAGVWLQGRFGVETYATGPGEQRLIALADGSRLALNTRSRIEVRLNAHRRDVRLLAGEAYFTVAHKPDRQPFSVEAGAARIEVTGTEFNVRRDEDQTRVDLLAGHVRIGAQGTPGSMALVAGQAIRVTASGVMSAPEPADANAVRDWRAGRVSLAGTKLVDAVRLINRYSVVPLVLDDESLGALKVDGVFEARDTRGFARAVATLYDLHLSDPGDKLVLSRRPPQIGAGPSGEPRRVKAGP